MRFHLIALLALTILFPSLAQAASTKEAIIINSKGEKIGTAKFTETKVGVQTSVSVSGLTPGAHGMHIHEAGQCKTPDFKSAGGHFNPSHKKHGKQNPQGAHMGDLPNLMVAKNGVGNLTFMISDLALRRIDSGKTAIVIHAAGDDGKTDPSGNSGDRIACGVIA